MDYYLVIKMIDPPCKKRLKEIFYFGGPCSMWDLSFPTRTRLHPCSWKCRVLTTVHQGISKRNYLKKENTSETQISIKKGRAQKKE